MAWTKNIKSALLPIITIYWKGRCPYCNVKLTEEGKTKQTWDHFIPRSRKGKDSPVNFLLVCNSCNQEKKHTHPFKFLKNKVGEKEAKKIISSIHEFFFACYLLFPRNKYCREKWMKDSYIQLKQWIYEHSDFQQETY